MMLKMLRLFFILLPYLFYFHGKKHLFRVPVLRKAMKIMVRKKFHMCYKLFAYKDLYVFILFIYFKRFALERIFITLLGNHNLCHSRK